MVSDPRVAQLRLNLERYMETYGHKSSEQRRLIVNAFLTSHGQTTVGVLWVELRKRAPRLSHTTVFRTLRLLAAAGVAHVCKFSDGLTYYGVANGPAHRRYFVCAKFRHSTITRWMNFRRAWPAVEGLRCSAIDMKCTACVVKRVLDRAVIAEVLRVATAFRCRWSTTRFDKGDLDGS